MRKNGILMPVSSLPGAYGIGTFSEEACRFVDRLAQSGVGLWQILPLGPTGYGDSPYQSFSTFAGNPYLIDLEQLIAEGLLTRQECAVCETKDEEQTDYAQLYQTRFSVLKIACKRSRMDLSSEYLKFQEREAWWLRDYALFMACKDYFGGSCWLEWPRKLRLRQPEAMEQYTQLLQEEIRFYQMLQYLFDRQWKRLAAYAHERGVELIGDIPIYVALDSADVWAKPELFLLDEDCIPLAVSGCPPDAFSTEGQLWGNPLYRWEYHRKTGYAWWLKRLSHCFSRFDVVRIDHFRGFDEYYAIPYGDHNAVGGHWEKGPGYELFARVRECLGEHRVIAEDLGYLTDSVVELVKKTGYPGMKVLQFAFDSREEANYLPYTYPQNSVTYTGTHDNDTLVGWFSSAVPEDVAFAVRYAGLNWVPMEERHWELIRLAMACVSDTVIIPMQDYLGLDSRARMNCPSTLGGNWKWRMKPGAFTDELVMKIRELTLLYGRNSEAAQKQTAAEPQV